MPGAARHRTANRADPDGRDSADAGRDAAVPTSQRRDAAAGSPDASASALRPTIRPMIPLGQFRDTFIIAVDDEGIAIIDQHVAHERVLFERVMERLTAGRARIAAAAGADGDRAAAGGARRRWSAAPPSSSVSASRSRRSATATIKVTAVPALLKTEDSAQGAARAGRGSRRARPRRAGAGRAAADRGDDRLPRGGEGELSADATRR